MMNANDVIESYVADVAGQLPRKQRNDVAFELRALLQDELAERAVQQARPPDKAMAMSIVAGFGRPAEMAARYAPRHSLIDPADNHNLLIWAIVGAVLLRGQDVFWLAWMGALLLIFLTMAWLRRRWPGLLGWRPRRYRDPDAVSRGGFATAAVFTLIFPLAMYVAPATFANTIFLGSLPTTGLSLTPTFVDSWQRIAVIISLTSAACIYALMAVRRRSWEGLRWAQVIVNAWLGLLLVMHAAPLTSLLTGETFMVFSSESANQAAAPYFLLAGMICLLGAMYEAHREWTRVRPSMPMTSVA